MGFRRPLYSKRLESQTSFHVPLELSFLGESDSVLMSSKCPAGCDTLSSKMRVSFAALDFNS